MPPDPEPAQDQRRLRLRFAKAGKVRFTSHRDVARLWERALRRSRLPVAYSQGFRSPPAGQLRAGPADGVRVPGRIPRPATRGRLMPGETPVEGLPEALSALLPEGIEVQAAALIEDTEGSLQQEVASCDWELEVSGVSSEELRERAETVLAAPVLTVSRERKGRPVDDDIRPAIRTLSVDDSDGRLRAELATHPRGVRPNDLVAALGADVVLERACRTHQWIERDGARFEPLQVSGLASSTAAAQNARRALPHVRAGSQPDPTGSTAGGGLPALARRPRPARRPQSNPGSATRGPRRVPPPRGAPPTPVAAEAPGRPGRRPGAARRRPRPRSPRARATRLGPQGRTATRAGGDQAIAQPAPLGTGTAVPSRSAATWSACTSSRR